MLGKRIVARVGYRMMSGRPYALMVKVKVKPERRDEFLAVMAADAVGTRAEPENLRFDLFQDDEDAHTYHLYSVYKSPKGLDAHRTTPHYKAWADFRSSGGIESQAATKATAVEWTDP